jgi:hypothetical protein
MLVVRAHYDSVGIKESGLLYMVALIVVGVLGLGKGLPGKRITSYQDWPALLKPEG